MQTLCNKKYYDSHKAELSAIRSAWRRQNPDKVRARSRNSRLQRFYGITTADYEAMHAAQDGKCAGCDRAKPMHGKDGLVPDHDHATGCVRQLLCNNCNMIVGVLETKPQVVERLKRYLATHELSQGAAA